MPLFSKIQRSDLYLLGIFLLLVMAIVLKAMLDTDGMVTGDAAYYLAAAQNILDGNAFTTTTINLNPLPSATGRDFFAIWPLGYPLLIAGIAAIFQCSVFWASKWILVFSVLVILVNFRIWFRENAYLYALMLCFAFPLFVMTSSWVEGVFMATLVSFGTSVVRHLQHPNRFLGYAAMLFLGILLFVVRYAGGVSVLVLGGVFLQYVYKRKWKYVTFMGGVVMFLVGFIMLYLYQNWLQTGFWTGLPRFASHPIGWREGLQGIFWILMASIFPITTDKTPNFMYGVLISVQILIGLFVILPSFKNEMSQKVEKAFLAEEKKMLHVYLALSLGLLLIASWGIWQLQSFRLFFPSLFLLWIGAFFYVQIRYEAVFSYLKRCVIGIAVISYFVYVPLWAAKQLWEQNESYEAHITRIQQELSEIPRHSIVVFADTHIAYLRTDLIAITPQYLPYMTHQETWTDFVKRVQQQIPNKPMYALVGNPKQDYNCKTLSERQGFHGSVLKVICAASTQQWIRVY